MQNHIRPRSCLRGLNILVILRYIFIAKNGPILISNYMIMYFIHEPPDDDIVAWRLGAVV
jgi:hypothetical protein